jgi:hypothetical protein
MEEIMLFIILIILVIAFLKAYGIMILIGTLAFIAFRWVYNKTPNAKKNKKIREKEAEEKQKQKDIKRQILEEKSLFLLKQAQTKREQEKQEEIKRENERVYIRDADQQSSSYEYDCIGHPNATLAIRYGIANLKKEVKEYWYHGKRGEKMRNPDRDTISIVPANTIQLQKIRKVKDDPEGSHYLAKLVDFGNREVVVVIKPGTEYVQTFYPKSEDWFKKYADLELVLKDNKTFDLKELAHFHVQKVVINS